MPSRKRRLTSNLCGTRTEFTSLRHDEFYPDGPFAAGVMGKIVTSEAFKRVTGLLKATQGTIAFGGDVDEATKAIAPTVVVDVPFNDALMSEYVELFLLNLIASDHDR